MATLMTHSEMSNLDVDSLATIFSFLTPAQICRLAHVSRTWAAAAASDVSWGRLLPPLCASTCFQKALEAHRVAMGDIELPFSLRPGAYEAEWRIARDPAEGERKEAEERLVREAEWAESAEAEAWRDLGLGGVRGDVVCGKGRGKGKGRKGRRTAKPADLWDALRAIRGIGRRGASAQSTGGWALGTGASNGGTKLNSGATGAGFVKDELEEEMDDVAAKLAFWRSTQQRSAFKCWEEWPLTSGAQVVIGAAEERRENERVGEVDHMRP
ncbi:unnamed protein product [Closterium sp. NIES-64]|nr:unnamed protein product [Closterium sp. NIES-64]